MNGYSDERSRTGGWRIALKGLSDTFENLLSFTLASLAWWLGVITLLFAPAATRALFQAADPRIVSNTDRPSVANAFQRPFAGSGRAWRLALIIGLPVLVLLSNLRFYTSEVNGWSLLIPLWLMVLVTLVVVGLTAFSIESLLGAPLGRSLRMAAVLCFGQPRRVASMLLVAGPVVLLGIVVVVPIATLLPATVAAIINRFVLESLAIPIVDPLTSTGERQIEESIERSRAQAARRFGP
jgi:uncharacterized membrane protein YesL